GRTWGIGQKGKDNGVLLIVAPNERRVRIEVGRGLEPVMTDALSKLIIENAILPAFRRGDFPGGIRAGVRDIKDVLLGDAEEVKERAKVAQSGLDLLQILLLLFWIGLALYIMWAIYRSSLSTQKAVGGRRRRGAVVVPGDSGGWGGGWSGGGDSGGGGGWSGGGGDFGGGGSSGSW
ncbi:MAG TPA: TPM domain-containing protein, partial [Hyphomicrobium sp.]